MQEQVFKMDWLGRELKFRVGKLAQQATVSVVAQYGETVVLATVVQSLKERDGVDFLPLSVEFEEKLYAAGIIKGSRWIKREGRPSDESILTGRLVDRAIRPLFNASCRHDIQVIITLLATDQENDYDVLGLIAASAALSFSGIEWRGPIGGVRVGRRNGQLIFNPTYTERVESDLDLVVAGTSEKVIMLEAGAQEVRDEDFLMAIKAGQEELQKVIGFIKETMQSVGIKENNFIGDLHQKLTKDKRAEKDAEKERVIILAKEWLEQNTEKILFDRAYYTKNERKMAVRVIKEQLNEYLFSQGADEDFRKKTIGELVELRVEFEVTRGILERKQRVDGRGIHEIRALWCEAGILPRVHGSSLFNRGETQVMSIITLGGPGLQQTLEGVEGNSFKRYIHHYNFPPFCVGEAKPLRGTGRREIGHGALAEKAIIPVLPTEEEFPYTIRVVSETLGSNGSSSMGATCASTLSLMDAGVPLKKKVAGIAMGLASNKDMSQWEVITDLQDLEDGVGGMDFKIAGTQDGITAIQMDTKTDGLTMEIVQTTLERGKAARFEILTAMDKAIVAPRAELSPYAPRLIKFMINPEKIGEVIGSGGKVINKIIAEHDVTIDIEDDGRVVVCGVDAEKVNKAVEVVKNIVREFAPGEKFSGKVVRIESFGAFVEIDPHHDGLVHVGEMAPYRVGAPGDLVKLGDEVTVVLREVDDKGRLNFTMKGLEENTKYWEGERGKDSGASRAHAPRGTHSLRPGRHGR